MTFTRTVVTVTEALKRYEADAILRDLTPDDDIEAIGVLLRPAFAGETLLRYLPATSDIEMSAYARSLWYFLAEVREGEATPSFANTKQRLLSKYRGVKPPPPPHQFVLLLYGLAERNLRTDDAERRLEEIHGYLELGLPWKVVSKSPMVVRVFGSLSSRDLPALCEALARLPPRERVVLDLATALAHASSPADRSNEVASSRQQVSERSERRRGPCRSWRHPSRDWR